MAHSTKLKHCYIKYSPQSSGLGYIIISAFGENIYEYSYKIIIILFICIPTGVPNGHGPLLVP